MKITLSVRMVLLAAIVLGSATLHGQVKGFEKIRWEREKIARGLVWKSAHTLIDDTVRQNINILIIDIRKRDISLLYNPAKNVKTSTQASEAGAIAAVNAGFFNVRDGGSVTYIKVGGLVVDTDTAKKWKRIPNLNGSLNIYKNGKIMITPARENSWYDSEKDCVDALITGPLLLQNKRKAILPQTSLVISRHPRSTAGTIGNHKLILVTLDGRTDQAAGMTLIQLADLMMLLKCKDAVNLDGGGSTTMYIKGKPFNGVVNMPCDNRKFDHEGERAVSNLVIVR